MGRNLLLGAAGAIVALLSGTGVVAAGEAGAARPAQAAAPGVVKGKGAYDQWCFGCHGPLPGTGMFPPAGTYSLQQRYGGKLPAVLVERSDLQPELIRLVVRKGVGIMPPTRKTEVTDEDLEGIIAYLTWK
jgi:mono/diheme cytochrome c family protein